jgi:hypothetical protein
MLEPWKYGVREAPNFYGSWNCSVSIDLVAAIRAYKSCISFATSVDPFFPLSLPVFLGNRSVVDLPKVAIRAARSGSKIRRKESSTRYEPMAISRLNFFGQRKTGLAQWREATWWESTGARMRAARYQAPIEQGSAETPLDWPRPGPHRTIPTLTFLHCASLSKLCTLHSPFRDAPNQSVGYTVQPVKIPALPFPMVSRRNLLIAWIPCLRCF